MTAEPGAEPFAALVGPAHVLGGAAAAAWTIDGVVPRFIVSPGTVDEVSRCLAEATARGLAVAPAGQGARLGWGSVPPRLDVVLALRRLDRLIAHEPADLTASVQAGLGLVALNGYLETYGQFLPLDPARAERSTIGGLVATAASGPYRARYGTMRDLLLGLTVVAADGTVVRGGGRVVKNVSGYDMPKLHVGALGTLGVVVECHLRLHPRPSEEWTRLAGFASAEAALEAAIGIRDTAIVTSRLELVDQATLQRLGHDGPPAAALAITLGSVADAVRAQMERVDDACRRSGGTILALEDPGAAWWRRVSDAHTPDEGSLALALRIGTRPGDVVKALRVVESAAAVSKFTVRATAELANGVLHALLGRDTRGRALACLGRVREGVAGLQGTCVVEHAPAAIKRGLDVWGDVGPALEPMRRLKAELDPRGTLNPGRFVGGI